MIQWVVSFLINQHTIAKTNKYTTLKLSIDLRLSQSLFLLLIFYLFFNADLLNDNTKKEVKAQKFIDNITLIIIDKSIKSNKQKLVKVYNKTGEPNMD